MEAETGRKVEEMVLDILKKSNIEEATEFNIRVAASERLGIDLSDPRSKQFVRSVVESYLLSVVATEKSRDRDTEIKEDIVAANEEFRETEAPKPKREDCERVICQLSNRRNVAVKPFKGTTLVSIREFYVKDGKLLPGCKVKVIWTCAKKIVEGMGEEGKLHRKAKNDIRKFYLKGSYGISLSSEQWSTFKKSVPAIEEAITKMEGRLRLELNDKKNGDASNSVVDVAPVEPVPTEVIRFEVPIEVIRFNGKNYQFWAQQMELLLKQLKIEYVLTELCPNSTLGQAASAEEIAAAKAAERRWLNDDLMCCRNILSHLSDHLFNQYANRKMSAKELWEEVKLVYLYEEFGTKRSKVKKYIEFEMVDEKAVVEQIRELNNIADSIAAAGISIDDNFHVSVIISKLPPSWKDFCIKLMREEYLPFWKLMEHIKIEEESRNGVRPLGEHSNNIGFHQANKGGLRRADYKPLAMCRNRSEINTKIMSCSICGKKGHLSKNCWRRYDKQANERKAEEDVRRPTEVDTPGATQ
ncbi:RNA polymerase II transcriptional coactivator KELP, partial [Mucuna pruriens]